MSAHVSNIAERRAMKLNNKTPVHCKTLIALADNVGLINY